VGVQGAFNSTGTLSVNTDKFTVDAATGNVFSQGTGYFGGAVGVQGAFNSTGTLSVNTDKFTVDAATGNVYSAGNAGIQGTFNSTGTLSVNTNKFTVDTSGNVVSSGTITVNDLTAATTSGAGALKVAGGEYIGKNLVINGTDSNTGTLTSNALYVAGGVGINNGLQVQGTAVFQNDVYFNGQTTYVYSTNTVYTDNLIEMHTTSTGVNGVWTFDDQKDIGIRFHYYQNSIGDLNAAFVWAADSHEFEFYRNGTETNGSFVSHDYAGIKAATLNLVGGTTATDTTTGDLVVTGGVGISGKLYVGGGIDGTVTTSTNIAGGSAGYIPIQSATGKTAFIPAGSEDGSLLTWNNANSTATWVSASSSVPNFARYAGTATNIAGGAAHDIPFQSATSTTSFDTGLFQYDSSLKTLKVDNVTIYGKGDVQATYTTNNAIVSANGKHIGVWSDTAVNLNYNNTNIIQVDSNGATLGVGAGGLYTLVLGTTGNLTLGGATGGGTFTAPFVNPDNLTSGRVTFYDGTSLADDSNLLYDSGTGTLSVGATDGNGSLYVGYNITVDTSGSVTLSYATQNAIAYIDSSNNLASDSNLAYDGTNVTLGGSGYVSAPVFEATSTAPTLTTSTGGAVSVAGGVGIAKDLYVGTTGTVAGNLTVQSDLYVDGTIYVKGASLTGVDKITGSTGTFQDIVSTGTIYANNITATNATFTGTVYVGGANIKNALSASTGNFGDITAHNILSTGTTTATNLIVQTKLNVTGDTYLAGTTASGILYVSDTTDNGVGFGKGNYNGNWSIFTEGGIGAAKNITAGGVVSAGDRTVTSSGNDTGSVDAFYAVNNMQAARTIKAVTGTTKVTIDIWDKTVYTTAKYLVQLVDTGVVHTEEIMLVQDGTNIYIAEYGIVYTTGVALGTFDANYSGNNVELTFTPAGATSMIIQVVRQSVLTAEEGFC
jgi:predicted acyltransferase (DUF342 family)